LFFVLFFYNKISAHYNALRTQQTVKTLEQLGTTFLGHLKDYSPLKLLKKKLPPIVCCLLESTSVQSLS